MDAKLAQIWEGDCLGRAEDAQFLQSFLIGRMTERRELRVSRSYVLNIDAGWGYGKSFFMRRFGQQLAEAGHIVSMVDAWQDDHADDPLVGVISAIDRTIAPLLKRNTRLQKMWSSAKRVGLSTLVAGAKGTAKHLTRRVIGEGLDAIDNELKSSPLEIDREKIQKSIESSLERSIERRADELLAKFNEQKNTIEAFKYEISEFLRELSDNNDIKLLFVLVDELDRCRPSYAITLLERIKHIFDIDGVVFVIATDTGQLMHSISAVYGSGFDSEKYLQRFFDRTYSFSSPKLDAFVVAALHEFPLDESRLRIPSGTTAQELIASMLFSANLSMRDAKRSIDILRTIITVWNSKVKLYLEIVFPIIMIYQIKHSNIKKSDEIPGIIEDVFKFNSPTMKLLRRDADGRGVRWDDFKICSIFKTFWISSNNIRKGLGDRSWAPEMRYAEELFSDEISAEFGGNLPGGLDPIASIAQAYPSMIASAGRLHGK